MNNQISSFNLQQNSYRQQSSIAHGKGGRERGGMKGGMEYTGEFEVKDMEVNGMWRSEDQSSVLITAFQMMMKEEIKNNNKRNKLTCC